MFKSFYHAYLNEFRLVIHDVGLIIFFLFLPLAYPVIYSLIYNPELVRDVRVVVVDNDRSSVSRRLVRDFDATQEAWVIGYAASLPEAKRAMAGRDCYAILEIPEGFGKKIGNNEQGNAVLYCEMSLLLRYRALLVAATNVGQALGAEIQEEKINAIAPLAETLVGGDLMPIKNVAMGNIEGGFDSFIMPGVLILILQQCIILASGMAGGARREHPHLYVYQAGDSHLLAVMFGRMLCYITILMVPILWLVHYVPLIFRFPMAGNLFEILCFLLPLVIAAIGIGWSITVFVSERESIFLVWVVTSVAFLFLSGLTWPRYAMPGIWKALGDCFPAVWGMEGFVRMNANGASLAQVSHDYIMLWVLAGAWLIVAYLMKRFRKLGFFH